MTIYARNFFPADSNSGDNVMKTNAVSNFCDTAAANQAPVSRTPIEKMVVRRGPQLMVVFSGSPEASTVQQLREANVKVGLALAPSELATASKLDDYSYVFVNVGRPGSSPLKQAVADLAHNGWSIDDSRASTFDSAEPRAPKTPVWSTELTMVQA